MKEGQGKQVALDSVTYLLARRKKVGESQYKTISGDLTLFSFPDGASSLVAYPEQYFELYPNIYNLSPVFTITEEEGILRISLDADYYPTQTFEAYDKVGNLQQTTGRDGLPRSYVWGYRDALMVAEAVNAPHDEIAYVGFEEGAAPDIRFGYIGPSEALYNSLNITTTEAHTGRYSYQHNYNPAFDENTILLAGAHYLPEKDYLLTLWGKEASFEVNFGLHQAEALFTDERGWTLYQVLISEDEPQVSVAIEVEAGFLDDIRLHPADAQMTTYTYDPLVGVTSETDANNVTTYYEYDDLNRLRLVKDQKRDIRQRYQYVYKLSE